MRCGGGGGKRAQGETLGIPILRRWTKKEPTENPEGKPWNHKNGERRTR